MQYSSKLKGSLLALLATISFSNIYIFSKLAMKDVNLASFGLLWFAFALLYNYLYYYFFTDRKKINSLSKKSKFILILIGCSEVISMSAFFLSIKLTENPAIVSFLANTSPIFVIFIGFVFLRIRYNFMAVIGIVVTLSGVVLINYNKTVSDLGSFVTPASIAALVFALFYGVSLVLARSEIKTIPSTMITVCRSSFLFLGFALYNLFIFEVPHYTADSLLYISIGSIFGPFLGVTLTFASLKFVDASITTLICTSRSFFIVIGAFLFMDLLPDNYQLLGGIFIILGIALITIGDIRQKSN
ncbi:hypothetical protein BZG01_15355 [Labilibaculum manganireducens]|uniref:EamA domain-containing protein n=1 Tax=Labilibaculum manganireducens TaxID=1940525 RepID=A0A2N3I0C4_9BACT|nr:DMT family transporter [Labilibaculum manganireducens]PKQ63693.1 hypothetical protein BZG01_15355 [Labilibaculum manganireducens]